MSIGGYKIRNKKSIHFITFAVVQWVDVFTRKDYRDIVVSSIRYCQQNKGLLLHAWCLMSNHIHFLASAREDDLSNILRDLKKFTSREIISAIRSHEGESRKEWMLSIFRSQGEKNSRNTENQFWRQENAPIECYSPEFTVQKLDYIHNNPVAAGIVEKPSEYIYSSAKSYIDHCNNGLLEVEFL
jgi:putative transposase